MRDRPDGDKTGTNRPGFDPSKVGQENKGWTVASNLMGMVNPIAGLAMKALGLATMDPTQRAAVIQREAISMLDPTPFDIVSRAFMKFAREDEQSPAPVETRDIVSERAAEAEAAAARSRADSEARSQLTNFGGRYHGGGGWGGTGPGGFGGGMSAGGDGNGMRGGDGNSGFA
jgi:hypothetical protein